VTRAGLWLGGAATAFYLVAAAPGGVWYDTQELSAAAFRLGVSHPPGQALYSVIGKAATLVPFGSVQMRTNWLSALAAGAAIAALFAVARKMSLALGAAERTASIAGIGAAAALATSDVLVGQATRTEVYAPAFLLFLLGLHEAIAWFAGPRDARRLAAAGVLAGLAATLHPPAGISVALATAWMALLAEPRAALRPRGVVLAFAGVGVGLLPLLLLFLRCRGDLQPCWVVEMTPAEFLRYVAGRGYSHNLQTGGAAATAAGDALLFILRRTGFVPAALLSAAALWAALRPRAQGRWGAAYLGAFLLPLPLLAVMAFEEANPDIHGYLLPAFGMLLAGAVAATSRFVIRTAPLVVVLALGVVGPTALASRTASVVRTRYVLPDLYQEAAFSEPPSRALLLTSSDQMYLSALHAQAVEGDRPDLLVMAEGLCGTKRHWQDARRRRPWMSIDRARPRPAATMQTAYAGAALDLAEGHAARIAESPAWGRGKAVSLGLVFDLDAASQSADAPAPAQLVREFDRHRSRYADGGDRVYRIVRQRRAAAMLLRGRVRAAVRELLAALWELSPRDRAAVLALPERVGTILPEPGLRGIDVPWISDEHAVRYQLASLAFQVGRSDLAARVLLPSYRKGNAFAALLLADILARDGRFDEARRGYRAMLVAHPEKAALARLGLALLESYQGNRAAARRHLRAAQKAEGAGEIAEHLGAAKRFVERSGRATGDRQQATGNGQ